MIHFKLLENTLPLLKFYKWQRKITDRELKPFEHKQTIQFSLSSRHKSPVDAFGCRVGDFHPSRCSTASTKQLKGIFH